MTKVQFENKSDLSRCIETVNRLCDASSENDVGPDGSQLAESFKTLLKDLREREYQAQKLDRLFVSLNKGASLEEMLDLIYWDFKAIIPFNRLGFALVKEDGDTVESFWAKSDQQKLLINPGFIGKLRGSSLRMVLEGGCPRIINDLSSHLDKNPLSQSTRLILEEGMQSSFTCPLIIEGKAVGFLFFSSIEPNTYANAHVSTFMRIANSLAIAFERARFIQELQQQKLEIEKQNERLTMLNQQKDTFLAIAAHDLRSPLAYGKLLLELLGDGRVAMSEDERRNSLNELRNKITYGLSLLDDLLNVAQIESGKLNLVIEELSLNDLIKEALVRHRQFAAHKEIDIIEGNYLCGTVQVDRTKIMQVIDNLLSNAIKYSSAGSLVTVFQEQTLDGRRFCVKDQGPGIAEADRGKLFKDFSKLGHKPTAGETSTGLGLAISRRIIEAHGGTIGVESKLNEGSTFWFLLPK